MVKRIINKMEIHEAHALIIRVFNLCHAGETTEEAQKCFTEGNTIEQFITGNNNGSIKIWGYFENNKMCGVAQLQDDEHFVNLFVLPDYQGKGIGRQLFNTVIDECKKIGRSDVIRMESLLSSVSFCQKGGAEICGDKQVFRELEYVPMIYKL